MLDQLGDRVDGDKQPALAGEFGDQAAVAGMHPGGHRRFIVGKLLVVGQVAAEIPQAAEAGDGGAEAGDDGQDDQKNEMTQQTHDGTGFSGLVFPGLVCSPSSGLGGRNWYSRPGRLYSGMWL